MENRVENAENLAMRKGFQSLKPTIIALFMLLFLVNDSAHAYVVRYKEQFYELYHAHYKQYPDDTMENIYWLERAVEADFCNPLYAMGKINDKKTGKNTATCS